MSTKPLTAIQLASAASYLEGYRGHKDIEDALAPVAERLRRMQAFAKLREDLKRGAGK